MHCESCGETIIRAKEVCPKRGKPIRPNLDVSENQPENAEEYSYVKLKRKITLFHEKLCRWLWSKGVLIIAVVFGPIMLIQHVQTSPRHVYKVGCNYLKDNVYNSEMDYKFKKFDKNAISSGKDEEVLDLGEGKMSYCHFYLVIPVTHHSDEKGDIDQVYKMEIFVHPLGYDGIFKKSRFVRCSGKNQENSTSISPLVNDIPENESGLKGNNNAAVENRIYYEDDDMVPFFFGTSGIVVFLVRFCKCENGILGYGAVEHDDFLDSLALHFINVL